MTRRWAYVEPGPNDEPMRVEISREDILSAYYPYWCEQMRKVGKEALINEDNCIDDFVVVHWAEAVAGDR
jgi:hypothetical protein